MSYNYYFEIVAVIIMAVLSFDTLAKHQTGRMDAKIFVCALHSQALMSLFDIASCVCLDHMSVVPKWLNILLIQAYFLFQAVTVFFFLLFLFSYPNHNLRGQLPYIVTAGAFGVANYFISLLSLFFPLYYYLDETGYHHGTLRYVGYGFYFAGLLLAAAFILAQRTSFRKSEIIALSSACGALILVNIFQMIFVTSLITGIATALALLLCYITMENPGSYLDRRTGANNTDALLVMMNEWHYLSDRYTMIILSIDRFPIIQNQIGFDNSADLMRQISEFLTSLSHNKRMVFRLEDDSLLLVVPGGYENLGSIEQDIMARFQNHFRLLDNSQIDLNCLFAACEYPKHFVTGSDFFEMKHHLQDILRKDQTLNVVYADDRIVENRDRAEAVEQALRHAINAKKLEVFYQPIYDAQTRKIVALEALSRLFDPDLGPVPPDEFVRVAEETGQIYSMGLLVIEKVCRFISEKLVNIPHCSVKTIEVNLSVLQLMNQNTITKIAEFLAEYKIPKGMINFEITESATATSPELLTQSMERLMELGCHFSLDDYGTGYSNINYLVRFPFNNVKFDKSLMWSYFDKSIAGTVIDREFDIIHELGKQIIAEGMEHLEYIEKIRSRNVRFFQGYYFAPALQEDKCVAYLKAPTPKEMFLPAP